MPKIKSERLQKINEECEAYFKNRNHLETDKYEWLITRLSKEIVDMEKGGGN